jgi:hypothetical protein
MQLTEIQPSRIAALEDEISRQRQEIDRLSLLLQAAAGADVFQIVEKHQTVADFTSKMFNHSATIQRERDPEIDAEYFVVSVAATGEVEEIVQKNHEWHVKLREVAGDLAVHYRLSLDIQ